MPLRFIAVLLASCVVSLAQAQRTASPSQEPSTATKEEKTLVRIPVKIPRLDPSAHQRLMQDTSRLCDRVTWANGQLLVEGTPDQIERVKDAVAKFSSVYEEIEKQEQARQDAARITFDFPGGSLGDYVDAIAKKVDANPFFFDSDDIRTLQMRPIKLQSTDLNSALALLDRLNLRGPTGETVRLLLRWIGPAQDMRQYEPANQLEIARRSICIISSDRTPQPETPTRRAVFLLDEVKPSGRNELGPILDAISAAIEMDGKSPTFKAKFHEASGLLIVRGTRDELSVVAQVLRAKFPNGRFDLPDLNDQPATAKLQLDADPTPDEKPTTPAPQTKR